MLYLKQIFFFLLHNMKVDTSSIFDIYKLRF